MRMLELAANAGLPFQVLDRQARTRYELFNVNHFDGEYVVRVAMKTFFNNAEWAS